MPPRALPPASRTMAFPAAHDVRVSLPLPMAIMRIQILMLLHITIEEGPCTLPKTSPTSSDL